MLVLLILREASPKQVKPSLLSAPTGIGVVARVVSLLGAELREVRWFYSPPCLYPKAQHRGTRGPFDGPIARFWARSWAAEMTRAHPHFGLKEPSGVG